jgi:hypothetical protein
MARWSKDERKHLSDAAVDADPSAGAASLQ